MCACAALGTCRLSDGAADAAEAALGAEQARANEAEEEAKFARLGKAPLTLAEIREMSEADVLALVRCAV